MRNLELHPSIKVCYETLPPGVSGVYAEEDGIRLLILSNDLDPDKQQKTAIELLQTLASKNNTRPALKLV